MQSLQPHRSSWSRFIGIRPSVASVIIIALLLAIVASCAKQNELTLQDWRYFKPIILPTSPGASGLVQIPLGLEILSGSVKNLKDLQIVASDDSKTPYSLVTNSAQLQKDTVPLSIKDKGYIVGLYTTFIADLSAGDVRHNQVEINITDTNFKRRAAVETSNDGDTWTQVAEKTIYDYSVKETNFSTRDVTVDYAESTARYVKVKIYDDGEGPLEAKGATVSLVKQKAAIEMPLPVASFTTTLDTQNKSTVLLVDVGQEGIPASHIALKTRDSNFNRDVSIETSSDKASWKRVSTATIFSYKTPRFSGSQLDFTYPESATRYIRIVIDDQDNPSINITGLQIWGNQRTLVFKPDPSESYKLYYGNPNVRNSELDAQYQYAETLPEARLGNQADNSLYVGTTTQAGEKYLWAIPVGIFAATFLAATILFLATRRSGRKTL